MRVSKADGIQVLDLQRDALIAAGIAAGHFYEDLASGRRDDRPGLLACVKALRKGHALVVGSSAAIYAIWSTWCTTLPFAASVSRC